MLLAQLLVRMKLHYSYKITYLLLLCIKINKIYSYSVSDRPKTSQFEPMYVGIGIGTLLILITALTVTLIIRKKRKQNQSTAVYVPATGRPNHL